MSRNSNSSNFNSNANGSLSFSSFNSMVWDYMNDPEEDEVEQVVEAQFLAEEAIEPRQHLHRQRRYIDRGREEGDVRLRADYFSANPVYTDEQFRRRFRMRRHVFVRVMDALSAWSSYFRQRNDALNRPRHKPIQKCIAAIRMLAYGTAADAVDEYVRIGETTALECLSKFAKGVNKIFGPEYLRRPTADDTQRLLYIGERRGFPGMLGSIDCMHWAWKICPVGWQGQFIHGDHGVPTMMLEAVASQDLWIWHAYFGVAGSNNDINVLNQSTLFTQTLQGRAPPVEYMVNGNTYNMGYYLADGIYPEWAAFVKTVPLPQNER